MVREPRLFGKAVPPSDHSPCEAAILALLAARDPSSSICPSEAARRVASETGGDWRALMPAVRAAADRLQARGEIEVMQRGRKAGAATTARGLIRLRLTARSQPRSSGMSS
jgi:hypothetical protein